MKFSCVQNPLILMSNGLSSQYLTFKYYSTFHGSTFCLSVPVVPWRACLARGQAGHGARRSCRRGRGGCRWQHAWRTPSGSSPPGQASQQLALQRENKFIHCPTNFREEEKLIHITQSYKFQKRRKAYTQYTVIQISEKKKSLPTSSPENFGTTDDLIRSGLDIGFNVTVILMVRLSDLTGRISSNLTSCQTKPTES